MHIKARDVARGNTQTPAIVMSAHRSGDGNTKIDLGMSQW
jgi:hypothetical protein